MQKKLTPEEIQQRINELKNPKPRKDNREFAKSLTLVASLGFAVVICILLGVWLGDMVVKKTGNDLWLPVFIFLGVIFAAYTAYKMIKPFLK